MYIHTLMLVPLISTTSNLIVLFIESFCEEKVNLQRFPDGRDQRLNRIPKSSAN